MLIAITGSHGVLQLRQINSELRSLLQKNRRLQEKIIEMNQKIIAVKSDPLVLEKKGREELGLSRQGEIIYIFPE